MSLLIRMEMIQEDVPFDTAAVVVAAAAARKKNEDLKQDSCCSSSCDDDTNDESDRADSFALSDEKQQQLANELAVFALLDDDDDDDDTCTSCSAFNEEEYSSSSSCASKRLSEIFSENGVEDDEDEEMEANFANHESYRLGDSLMPFQMQLEEVNSSASTEKRVRFGTIQIREYAVTVGVCEAAPSIAPFVECPIELDWEHASEDVYMNLCEHSCTKGSRVVETSSSPSNSRTTWKGCREKYRNDNSAGVSILTAKQRRERIAAVQGISVKEVMIMEINALHQKLLSSKVTAIEHQQIENES